MDYAQNILHTFTTISKVKTRALILINVLMFDHRLVKHVIDIGPLLIWMDAHLHILRIDVWYPSYPQH